MEGIWYLLLILALYLLPELLKKLRQQQAPRYEYPPPPPVVPLEVEMAPKEEDGLETAKLEKESEPARRPLREVSSSSGRLTPQTIVQGVIWAELLKPPLSKRQREMGRIRRS